MVTVGGTRVAVRIAAAPTGVSVRRTRVGLGVTNGFVAGPQPATKHDGDGYRQN